MSDLLRKAIKLGMDLNLWPPEFVKGCYAVAVKNRLNVVSVMLAFVTGTSVFVGKSEIKIDKTDRTECGSLWVLNVQVCFLNRIFVLHRNNFLFFKKKNDLILFFRAPVQTRLSCTSCWLVWSSTSWPKSDSQSTIFLSVRQPRQDFEIAWLEQRIEWQPS